MSSQAPASGGAVPFAGLSSGGTPDPHAPTHENGGSDEIDVTGLSGLLADGQTPLAHAATHENGGADEIDVTGLSGLLSDPQTPTAHASSHSDGGSDEIDVADLATASLNTAERLRPDGAGGLEFVSAEDICDFDAGSDTTSGSTPITKCSVTIPAEDATFIIEAAALVSHSDTTGNPSVRLRNTTDAVTLGRVWNSEMEDAANILTADYRREFVQTAAAGAKTIELQYFVTGSGTMTISDALLCVRRKVE